MMLTRRDPVRALWAPQNEMFNIQREMNRMFRDFFRGNDIDDSNVALATWAPAVDIAEFENEYLVKAELPGVNKDDVKITLESNILTLKGEKKQEKEVKNTDLHHYERIYGAFQRSFTLPSTVKSEKIEAQFKDGVLTITLPKQEEAKPKQIEVKVK